MSLYVCVCVCVGKQVLRWARSVRSVIVIAGRTNNYLAGCLLFVSSDAIKSPTFRCQPAALETAGRRAVKVVKAKKKLPDSSDDAAVQCVTVSRPVQQTVTVRSANQL